MALLSLFFKPLFLGSILVLKKKKKKNQGAGALNVSLEVFSKVPPATL